MRLDRDATDRGSMMDRRGGVGVPALLAAYLDSSSDVLARLAITQNLSGYPDNASDIHAALLLPLAAHADSGTDIYARLQIGQNISAYLDGSSDEYARLRIDQNLKIRDVATTPAAYGREQLDRAGLDRRYSRTTPQPEFGTRSEIYGRLQLTNYLSGHLDTNSDIHARLRLDQILKAAVDTTGDTHAALLLALASYIESGSEVYARLQIGSECKAQIDSSSDEYARLEIAQLLKAAADSNSDQVGRLQITHNAKAHPDTVSDIHAQLRQIDSWTFTFSGTLAPGKTLCIDSRDFTVKNDGVNAIANFSGDFPTIFPGSNWVIYTDAEGSRTIQIVVSKRDRNV